METEQETKVEGVRDKKHETPLLNIYYAYKIDD